jgi:2-oxoglutarate ferredoxin oxidoreductase subunit beta
MKYLREDWLPTVLCPGCGDGIVLQCILRAIDEQNIDISQVAIVAGVGCHARLGTGYVAADSMWTLHGRAMPIATGIKLVNPKLHVVVLTGDGDCGAIGLSHFIHAARRNVGILTVCFNNGIYGMTGGQVAPTTPRGTYTKATPFGNLEPPLDLCSLAKIAGASYVARWTTAHPRQLTKSIERAFGKKGFAFVEAVTQCPTYYGRYALGTTSPSDMLRWFLRNSVTVERAKNLGQNDLFGRIIIGEFADVEKPELSDEYKLQTKTRTRPQEDFGETVGHGGK